MPVPGVRDAVAIAAGGMFCVALLANGTVMTWGRIDNNYSSLKITPKPVPVPGVSGIRAIAAGNGHAAGITDAGTVVTWGTNQFHQLGRGRNVPLPPGPVASLTGAVSLTAAAATTIAVLSSGRIMTWGGVRPWHQGEYGNFPILLWIDGLDQS
jgi:alpha-tubulin suppressor-like RCC1 family protein